LACRFSLEVYYVWADIPNNRERAHYYFNFIILPFTSKREIEEARAKVIRWRLREDGEGWWFRTNDRS